LKAISELNDLTLTSDVLVIGGGMAAAWAAIAAAREGADVTLVDKGYLGTSGVTATGGPNHWWVSPEPGKREAAIDDRHARGYGLADKQWMARIIDETWRTLPELGRFYAFGGDGRGGTFYSGVRGPEYMRALRRYALESGVRILDHHPALELLVDRDGAVAGAAGYARIDRRAWTIHARATIMATGGCGFRSGLIGSYGNTGDGYLMAAEAGAELSGMEFTTAYSLSPAWNSTRTLPYFAARFFDAGGVELDIPPPRSESGHQRALASAMIEGPVYADLGDAPEVLKKILRRIQPASLTPFERKGVSIFEDRFEVKLFGEGTIRGIGGLRIIDDDCQTTIEGLYAAGDAATRELIAGATSGGGAQNSAWALTSGRTAGRAAARRAVKRDIATDVIAVGTVGLRPTGSVRPVDQAAIIGDIQTQMVGYEKALWRSETTLSAAQTLFDDWWQQLSAHAHAVDLDQVALRETASMTATARWSTAAALERRESRGMHVRVDAPDMTPERESRLLTGGLDRIWTRYEQPVRGDILTEIAA
jgi:succinate dehydrogenase/fumarate reductase flavoprotein subunit